MIEPKRETFFLKTLRIFQILIPYVIVYFQVGDRCEFSPLWVTRLMARGGMVNYFNRKKINFRKIFLSPMSKTQGLSVTRELFPKNTS